MAVTIIKDLEQSVAEQAATTTIGELANGYGRYYRHPDSAQISYPQAVKQRLGVLPSGGTTTIGIVGGGTGGIAALYELRQLAEANPSHDLEIVIFESDPSNFLFTAKPPSNPPEIIARRAGRVSSYWAPNAVYEIGAMRFPSIAGLTWHYAERAFGPATIVNPFPNPGTVPTEFVFGSRFDRYFGGQSEDPTSPSLLLRQLVLDGLSGKVPNPLYMIGPRTAENVIDELRNAATPQDTLAEIQADWEEFIRLHDGTTLEAAVRAILTAASEASRLPVVPGLSGSQLINWCVELFGRFGFGTGGFKPLYNISIVEMMRLILWDYNNEYTFPAGLAPGNVEFIARLHEIATMGSPANFLTSWKRTRVSDIFHQVVPRRAGVAHYQDEGTLSFEYFDYVIVAVPHDGAFSMMSRLGYSTQPLVNPEVGDIGRSRRPGSPQEPVSVLPGLLLSTLPGNEAINARISTAVGMLHMTRSSKVFAMITSAAATQPPVPHFPAGSPISAVISDCGLAAAYMVPSTTNAGYRGFLVSYTWEDDSTKLENAFGLWPENISPPGPASMFETMLNRAYRQNPASPNDPNAKWWFSEVLSKSVAADRVSWDWSTYATSGGFKLDMTGDYHQSNLCFRYHTHARFSNPTLPPDERLNSRVFLASDSYSHLGGWLEGAFMSAINAVAGIVVSINSGDFGALNDEARKLFTTLKPILPMV